MNQRKLKEKLSNEFADLLRQLINSIDELDEYGDIENLFSSSLWLKAFYVRDRAEEILKEHGLKIWFWLKIAFEKQRGFLYNKLKKIDI